MKFGTDISNSRTNIKIKEFAQIGQPAKFKLKIHLSFCPQQYFNRNPKEFLRRVVTMDETWIHLYSPKSRKGSKQQIKSSESAPKRPKTQQSSGKVMLSVFWNALGLIFIDYLEKGRTITGVYYDALLNRLVDEIRNKRPHLKRKTSYFMVTMHQLTGRTSYRQKKHELGFESLPASTVFSRAGPQRLLSVPKPQEMAVWQEFLVKRRS